MYRSIFSNARARWNQRSTWRPRPACLIVGAVAAAASVVAATTAPAVSLSALSNSPPDGCAQVRVVGVRGSGQNPLTNNKGLGPEVERFYDRLQAQLSGVDVRVHAIPYDAVAVGQDGTAYPTTYYYSVQYGINLLTDYIQDHLNKCKSEHIVMAGYSQGADVVHQVWNSFAANGGLDRTRGRLDGLILFADPRFDPTQTVPITPLSLDQGNFDQNGYGILADIGGNGPVVWESSQQRYHLMRSYCQRNDIVCNSGLSKAVHTSYNQRGITLTAANAMSLWLRGHYFH